MFPRVESEDPDPDLEPYQTRFRNTGKYTTLSKHAFKMCREIKKAGYFLSKILIIFLSVFDENIFLIAECDLSHLDVFVIYGFDFRISDHDPDFPNQVQDSKYYDFSR